MDPRIEKEIDKHSYTRGWQDHLSGFEPGEFEKLDMASYWCGWNDRDVIMKASEDAHESADDIREVFRQQSDATGEPYGIKKRELKVNSDGSFSYPAPTFEEKLTPEDLKLMADMKIKI